MKNAFCALMLCLGVLCQAAPAQNYNLTSPDGKLKVDVSVGDNITWSLNHVEDALIVDSPISMTLSDGVVYGDGDKVTKVSRRSVDATLATHVYKKSHVKDAFNEMTLKFKEFSLVFRAYDEGMAYRFVSHSKTAFQVKSEQAVFAFAQDWNMWVPYVHHLKGFEIEAQLSGTFENL